MFEPLFNRPILAIVHGRIVYCPLNAMSGRPLSVRNVANPHCKYNNNLQYSKYPNHIFFLNKTLSFATTYGGNVISHQETNKATTMAVTLVSELQNFICPQQEFVSRSFFSAKPTFCSLPSHWILQNKKTDTYSFDGWNRCLL